MTGYSVALGIVVLLAATTTARADGGALIDTLGVREISVGESMRAGATGGMAISLNPAGLALNRELVFEGTYAHRPDDGAQLAVLSACDSTVPVPGCFYYKYFSADPTVGGVSGTRTVHEGGWSSARSLAPQVSIGVTAKYFDFASTLDDEPDASGFSFDVGTVVRATAAVNLALVGYNLWGEDSVRYPRAIGTGLMLKPVPALSVSADGLWNLEASEGESTGRYGGGVEFFLQSSDYQSGYPFRLGIVHDVQNSGTFVTGGLGFSSRKLGVDLGVRKQVGGDDDELMLLGSLRIYGPRLEIGGR